MNKRSQVLAMYPYTMVARINRRGHWCVWLDIGNQSFRIEGYHTKKEALLMRRMLAVALANLPLEEVRRAGVVEALERIAEGAGPYNLDPLKHAENTINDAVATAQAALANLKRLST